MFCIPAVAEVFEAFINPDITTKFWFKKSSGRLEKGKKVTWTWEMYDVNADVIVKDIVPNISRIWRNRSNMPVR